MMDNAAQMGESPMSEETTDATQVDHPAARALLEAQSEYQSKTKGLLEGYYKAVGEIRDYIKVDTEQQKSQIITSHKAQAGEELYQKTVSRYEEAVERFSQQAHKQIAKLRADLFNVGEACAAALSQAVGADEEQLIRMIELADLAGDPTLARAAFGAGVVRGDVPKAVWPYLDSNPEAEGLLRVYEGAPKADWFETTRANITRMIQPPTEDQLRSRPEIRAY